MVIWLIGLSGSGKTTIGKELINKLQYSKDKWFFLDGDIFRNILNEDLGHTLDDRVKNGFRISRFCEYLSNQGINVVACVLSVSHKNQKYNRKNIKNYKEVFIDVDFKNLIKRDNKELYKKALNGNLKNVVGVDIKFKPPYSPDLVINNNIDNSDHMINVEQIISSFNLKINKKYNYTPINLLKNPQKYQYSKFEGKEFFKLYRENRLFALDFLKKRKKKIEYKNLSKFYKDEIIFIKGKNIILKKFLTYLYISDNNNIHKYKKIIDLLIKRFEVSKKLYLTYDLKKITKTSIKFDELLNYSLFSLVLLKLYPNLSDHEKMIYLNSILKVNDIIVSILNDLTLYKEINYSIKAISNELIITKQYLR